MALPDPQAMHQRADWLCAAVVAMREGRPVPAPAAQWLADGVERFLSVQDSRLDDALGLRVPPGGGHCTIWRVAKYGRRDRLLAELAATLQGSTWSRARTIAGWLAGEAVQAAEPSAHQAELLGRLLICRPPRSASQLNRVLSELHQRPHYSKHADAGP